LPVPSALGAPQPTRGVSVDLGRIAIREHLLPGGSYRLPTLGVRNPGNVRTRYRAAVGAIQDQSRRVPPERWFHFSPGTFTLEPGETRPVAIKLSIPTGAEPGDYEALVGARIAPEGNGAQVGTMAASRITFTVDASSTLEAWRHWVETFLADHTPWSYVLPALLGFLALLWWLQKRFRLRLLVERRS